VSPPGVEPGLRPSQSRVPPPHPEDRQYPDLDSNQGPDLRRVRCIRYTIGTSRAGGGGRTRINRITSAAPFYLEPHRPHDSRSARIRTLCGWFGISLLSQEHAPVNRPVCLAGVEPGTPRFTASYASRYTTDTADGVGVEPTRPCGSLALQARPVAESGSPSVSSPGWNRTTDLLRVGEAPWPLDHGTVSTPARSRTRTSSFEARRDVRFTTRASSGR
jgi:hypothetical protein